MRLTWKREPRTTARRLLYAEHARVLHLDGQEIGRVALLTRGFGVAGYYWWACADRRGVPPKNTARRPCLTLAAAKAECLAYVVACLVQAVSANTTK